jgi:hypothetical protein
VTRRGIDDWNSVGHGSTFRRRHHAEIGLNREGVDRRIDIVGLTNANCDWLYRRCAGGSFESAVKQFA